MQLHDHRCHPLAGFHARVNIPRVRVVGLTVGERDRGRSEQRGRMKMIKEMEDLQ